MKPRTRFLRPIICLLLLGLLLAQCVPALAVSGSTSLATAGSRYIVIASSLNCRSGPGMQYGVITRLKRGTTVTYLSRTNGWWRVRSSTGVVGYVDRQFLTQESASKVGSYFVKATALRVRATPSTSSRVVGTVKKGTVVTISQLNGDWGYVSGGASVRGWVALSYLSTSSVSAGSSSTNTSSRSYVVTASALNVRAGASASARRITSIKKGTVVTLSQTNGNWGYISYYKSGKLVTGWVSLSYLRAQ